MEKKLYSNPIFALTLLLTYCILYMLLLNDELLATKAVSNIFGIRKEISLVVILADFFAIGVFALTITTRNFFHAYNQSKDAPPKESFILLPIYLLYSFAWFLIFFNFSELSIHLLLFVTGNILSTGQKIINSRI